VKESGDFHQQISISVSRSLRECLEVVRSEFQGGQIPELTGLMQWPMDTPGSTCKHR